MCYPPPQEMGPEWDGQRRTLHIGSQIVKRFRLPAANQEAVLSAFQEEGWPHRIDDPLQPCGDLSAKERLHFTIKRLNQHQRQRLIRFSGDGTGEGVCWEHIAATAATLSANAPKLRRAA
jgi:hypothetical protein